MLQVRAPGWHGYNCMRLVPGRVEDLPTKLRIVEDVPA